MKLLNFIFALLFSSVFFSGTNVWAEGININLERMGVKNISDREINISGSRPYLNCIEPLITGIDRRSRIVNGRLAIRGKLPWQVGLLATVVPNNERAQFCGGTLIHKNWVVTAAHCVDGGMTAARLEVLVGEISLRPSAAKRIPVSRIIVHPDYNQKTINNDIALLRLKYPAEGDNITPIPLISTTEEGNLTPTTLLVVSGWGAIYESGPSSSVLRDADVTLIERQRCNGSSMYEGKLTDMMICAGDVQRGVDSCQGDSGGPLVLVGEPISKLVGIVSWGSGCARVNKPGVYTRVSSFGNWVTSHITQEH